MVGGGLTRQNNGWAAYRKESGIVVLWGQNVSRDEWRLQMRVWPTLCGALRALVLSLNKQFPGFDMC